MLLMAQIRPLHPTVPITAFNRGQAGKIFSNVKQSGMTVVMKNVAPLRLRFTLKPQKVKPKGAG